MQRPATIPVSPASKCRKFPWREWIPAILWIILIAIESTPWLSFQNTGHVLYALVATLFGAVNATGVSWVNTVLREMGHVTGYGMLSWLLFRAWRATLRSDAVAWTLCWAVIAFCMSVVVASLDEWHQSYLPSRGGSIHDVYLDGSAALAVQILLFALWRKRRSRQPEDTPAVAVGENG